jgi:hypothetical protein
MFLRLKNNFVLFYFFRHATDKPEVNKGSLKSKELLIG